MTTSTSSSAPCLPLWATARTPERPTIGGRDRRLAELLGIRPAGWQSTWLDVAGELDVDPHGRPTGRMAYPIVVGIVPRRAGKTLAAFLRLLAKSTSGPAVRGWYTCHRREVGAALWRDEWFPMIDSSRLSPLLKTRRSNGSETITVRRLGSTVRLFAPSGEALRSQNADLVVVDEGREFTLEDGDTLEAAVRPAQTRRRGRQLWIISSAGDLSSTYLAKYRDLGRAAAGGGERSSICYLEFGAPQDAGLDPYHPDTIRLGHPSVADGDVDVETILADADTMSRDKFTMEYLGWWNESAADSPIPLEAWAARALPAEPGVDSPFWAIDVAADRSRSALARCAGLRGTPVVEIVDERAGTAWVAQAAKDIRAMHRNARFFVDELVAASIVAELTRLRVPVETIGAGQLARACSLIKDDVLEHRMNHRAQAPLDDAVAGAASRNLGDGWAWSRRTSDANISPLVAATIALWAWRTNPPRAKPGVGTARHS